MYTNFMKSFLILTLTMFLTACGSSSGTLALDGTWTETAPNTFATFCTNSGFPNLGCKNTLTIAGASGAYASVDNNGSHTFNLTVDQSGSNSALEIKSSGSLVETGSDGFPSSDFNTPIDWQGTYSISGNTLTITEKSGTVHTFTQ